MEVEFTYPLPGASGSDSKESTCNAGDMGSIPGSGRSPGAENGTHTSILAWKIPWTEKPGGLQSMGSQRGRHDWGTNIFTLWSFTEIQFTYQIIHSLKIYNSLHFSAFTELCNHHHKLIWEYFHTPKINYILPTSSPSPSIFFSGEKKKWWLEGDNYTPHRFVMRSK